MQRIPWIRIISILAEKRGAEVLAENKVIRIEPHGEGQRVIEGYRLLVKEV